jgi:hypothetical protein
MDDSDLDLAQGGDTPWAFWRTFADAELFLVLTEEPKGADLSPRVFDVSDGRLVLAFDREDRLAGFAPVPVPYAALPGRVLAALAAGQGLAVGLNLGTGAASETVLPVEALGWLIETLDVTTPEAEAAAVSVAAPVIAGLAAEAVAAAVAGAAGLAGEAILAEVTWADGRRGQVLAFPGVALRDEAAVARAVAEALALSGLDAAALDVAFPDPDAPFTASLRRVGRRYLAEAPVAEVAVAPQGPGMDRARPPRLK